MAGTWLGQCALFACGYSIVLFILLISAECWRVTTGPLNMPGIISLTAERLRRRHGQARTRRGPEGSGAARGAVPEPASRAGVRCGVPGRGVLRRPRRGPGQVRD